jgi:hypothetical protein
VRSQHPVKINQFAVKIVKNGCLGSQRKKKASGPRKGFYVSNKLHWRGKAEFRNETPLAAGPA